MRRIAIRYLLLPGIVLLSNNCSDDPQQSPDYNDASLLLRVTLKSATALVVFSEAEPDPAVVQKTESQHSDKLFRLEGSALTSAEPFEIEGNPDNGFRSYLIRDIDQRVFLIRFPLRNQTYFVDKSTGNATLTNLELPFRDLVYSSPPFGASTYYTRGDSLLIQHDDHLTLIEHFLGSTPRTTQFPKSSPKYRVHYFDKNGSIYYSDEVLFSLFRELFSVSPSNTSIADDLISIWNNHDGDLKAISADGQISTILQSTSSPDGIIDLLASTADDHLLDASLQTTTLSNSTFGILRIRHDFYLLNLDTKQVLRNLSEEGVWRLHLFHAQHGKLVVVVNKGLNLCEMIIDPVSLIIEESCAPGLAVQSKVFTGNELLPDNSILHFRFDTNTEPSKIELYLIGTTGSVVQLTRDRVASQLMALPVR